MICVTKQFLYKEYNNYFLVGAEYSIYMRAYTQSMYIESFQYPGNKSEIIHILAGKDCDRVQVTFFTLFGIICQTFV